MKPLSRFSLRTPLFGALLASVACTASLDAQTEVRGFSKSVDSAAKGTWRAVVVGVSRYKAIPKLSFADNDAEALYQYLIQRDGGGLDSANVALFLDDEATAPAINQALLRMAEASHKGDRLLLYFAGHGDVQRIRDSTVGSAYLLLANATAGLYDGSNDVLNPQQMQGWVQMRMRTGAEFLIVLDACRSGAVADTREGAEHAMRQLSSWQGVNKLLSSTGAQLSHESAEWGGGHGVFTYYLLEALYGLADANRDSTLTFREIDRYVSDSVEAATLRRSKKVQTPTNFSANPTAPLFRVEGRRDLAIRKLRSGATLTVADGTRAADGGSAISLEIRDSIVARMVAEFQRAIDAGRLLDDSTAGAPSAWSLQRRIVARLDTSSSEGSDLAQRVRGSLAVALQEFAENPARRFFRGVSDYPSPREFRAAARALHGARELLGAQHAFANDIRWREEFMSAFAIVREADFSRFDEAERQLRDALTLTKGAAPVHAGLATLYRAKRDLVSARRHITEAIRLAPRWEYAHKLDADLLHEEGKVADAIEAYAAMTRRFPTSSAAHNNAGVLFLHIDRYADARRSFQRAWQISNEPLYLSNLAAVALDQRRLDEADSLLTVAEAMDSTLATVHHQRGRLLRARHEGAAALAAFRRALALDSFDIRPRYAIGDMLESSDAEAAIQEFRSALAIDPDDDDVASSLAWRLHEAGKTGEGEALLRTLDARRPHRAEPAHMLGWFYAAIDRPDDAERWYREAIRRDSLYSYSHTALAGFLAGRGRQAEAETLYAKAATRFVGNPVPAIAYARHLFGRGALARAASAYEQAIAYDPLSVNARAELAEVLGEQGKARESLAQYRRAIEGNPSAYSPLAVAMRLETRAAALEFERRDTLALEFWKAARALQPDRVRSALGIARVSYSLGNTAAARAALDSIVATLDADDDDVLPVVRHIRSLLLLEAGDVAGALRMLDAANARRPAADLATRATMLWALGRRDEALAALGAAVRPTPLVRLRGRGAAAYGELARARAAAEGRP